MPLLDTRRDKDLMGTFIADLVLQILAYVAETERTFIKQRQREGIEAAKRKGVRFGAERKVLPINFEKYYQMWRKKNITVRQAAKELGISSAMFHRRCKEMYDENDAK